MTVMMERLLQSAIDRGASDLHLSAGMPPWLRISGHLCVMAETPLQQDELQAMLYAMMTEVQQCRFSQQHEVDFAYHWQDTRLRVNIYRQQRGMAAALRFIPNTIPAMEVLRLPLICQHLIGQQHGLILITGPTGSGKSTSLAALIQHINQRQARHIITIEDPIEFIHTSHASLISQREVSTHTLAFEAALRAALREDPDVICVAELRDLETIRLALTAAETGHLVLGTLHTASAAKTIDRIVDVFPGNEKDTIRALLAESLLAIISQQLVQHAGSRRAEFEVLIATPAIRHLIRENKPAQIYSAMQTGQAVGMCTFSQSRDREAPISAASRLG